MSLSSYNGQSNFTIRGKKFIKRGANNIYDITSVAGTGGNFSTGWVKTDGTTEVADGATLTFDHNLGTTDLVFDVYVADDNIGTNAFRAGDAQDAGFNTAYGASIQSITDSSFVLQLGSGGAHGGAMTMNSSGDKSFLDYAGKYIKVILSAGGGSGQVEVVSKKWSGQYDAIKMGGDPLVYATSHTVEFDAPSVSLSSIKSIRYDLSVMAHKHVIGGVNSTQGWYRFKGTVPSVGGHEGNPDYEIPYVDTRFPGTNNPSHGNHASGTNNYNPYTSSTTTGTWFWESASSVGHDLVHGTVPIPDFPFVTSVTLDPSSNALGYQASRHALDDSTLTINSNGSATIVLDQSSGGYDGQTLAMHGSIIYSF